MSFISSAMGMAHCRNRILLLYRLLRRRMVVIVIVLSLGFESIQDYQHGY